MTARAQRYDYVDFGRSSPSFCPPGGGCTTFSVDQNAHLALFGVNYRFASWRQVHGTKLYGARLSAAAGRG